MSLRVILWKDVKRELRSKEGLAAGLVLVALFLVLELWSLNDISSQPETAALVLWIPATFAAAAIAGRGMAKEVDHGTAEWLRSLPVAPITIGLSRTLIDFALIFIMAASTLTLSALLFAVPLSGPVWLFAVLGSVGLAVMGSMVGAIASHASAREILLPILLVPVVAPLLMACVEGTIVALQGGTWTDLQAPLLIGVGFDLMAVGVAWLLWPVVLEGD